MFQSLFQLYNLMFLLLKILYKRLAHKIVYKSIKFILMTQPYIVCIECYGYLSFYRLFYPFFANVFFPAFA